MGVICEMKDLIIVGAGETGRERLDAIKKINAIEKNGT